MRTETRRQGERRAARMHWLRQVLDRPAAPNWNELLDEMVAQRFCLTEETPGVGFAEVEFGTALGARG